MNPFKELIELTHSLLDITEKLKKYAPTKITKRLDINRSNLKYIEQQLEHIKNNLSTTYTELEFKKLIKEY